MAITPLTPRIDTISSEAALGNALAYQQGINNIVDVATINASAANGLPTDSKVLNLDGTTRYIYDLGNDLNTRFGVERIQIQQIYEIHEIGTSYGTGYNGTVDQKVWGVIGDKSNQIRFVGADWINASGTYGNFANTTTTNHYVEIIFYGTGLNMLTNNFAGSMGAVASIDGAAEESNLYPASLSNILGGRNYAPNIVLPVKTGLTLGWHIIRIRVTGVTYTPIYGFEFLTESSTINTRSGTIYGNDSKNTLATVQNVSYNTTFESGTLGTKGGCVAVYLKSDGTIGKAVTPTDTGTPLYLSNANHVNEECIKTTWIKEFAAGRPISNGDDWWTTSINAGWQRAFTCDDGTTTLMCNSPLATDTSALLGGVGTGFNSAFFWTVTFIGTGLDFDMVDTASGGNDAWTYKIDNGSATPWVSTAGNTSRRTQRIVSGLPYGTHTFTMIPPSSGTWSPCVIAFKIYAPKLPTIPSGAILLNQYYLMADYSPNTTAGLSTIGTGLLRKYCSREFTYVGSSWAAMALNCSTYIGGWQCYTNGNGDYFQYTFYGTGFEYRVRTQGASTNVSVTINTLAATTANFPTLVSSVYGDITFSSGTMSLNGSTQGSGCRISGLPLAKYTVRFTNNTTSWLLIEALDIITPIHYPKIQTEGVRNNTISVGSCALGDKRNVPTTTKTGKVWAIATGVTADPNTSSGSYVPVPDMSLTVNSPGALFDCKFNIATQCNGSGTSNWFRMYVDGLQIGTDNRWGFESGTVMGVVSDNVPIYLSKGVHKVDLYWACSGGGPAYASTTMRKLIVEER